MGTRIVYTRDLFKFFGDVVALDGLNLEVPKGICGFIGPNGAGKTTTINILLGLLKPDSGEAYVFGLDCWRNSYEIKRRVGVLHESPSYPRNFSAQRFLKYVSQIYGIENSEKRVFEMLKLVGLYDVRDRAIKGFSAGMLQRLGLAQALIGEPELVILDEPTANLDPFARIMFLDKVKEFYKDYGVNFLISTHILPELEKVCSWVSIIMNGVIVDQGFFQDLVSKYSANVYTVETSDPKLLARELEKTDFIKNVWIEGGKIHCKISDLDQFHRNLPAIASKIKVSIRNLQPQCSTLEEIYREVVRNEK